MSAIRGEKALPDAADRERAATVFDRNLVVTAGAGTGKTALLVERALNLIGSGRNTVESIAAITFTEKAAAELRSRLASGLDELRHLAERGAAPGEAGRDSEAGRSYRWLLGRASVPASAIRTRALDALVDLDAASISTIHAFCAEILRRHPREAGVDPYFAVDEGAAFDTLFEEEWERFLLDEFGSSPPRADFWRRALLLPDALGAVGALGRALASFAFPSETVSADARYAAAPASLFGEEAAAIRGAALGILARATGINPGMKDFLSASVDLLDAFLDSGPEAMAAADSTLSLEVFLTRDPAPGAKLSGADPDEVEAVKRRARRLIGALARVDESTVGALVEAALPLAARVRERVLASGLISFDGLLRLARDLLARHPHVRRELAARHRTLLVDEFQDTDPVQYEILFFIAEDDRTAARDAYEAALAPGCLFIVGDPKQSIYRFRGADIEAYRRAVDRVIQCGGERLTLTASFRSPAGIVDPINAIFGKWMGPHDAEEAAYEPPYHPIASARGGAETASPNVEIWSVEGSGNASALRRIEAEAIASWIAGHAGRPEATVEPFRFRDVALLFRALTDAGLYAQALRRLGIPFVVEGGKDFYVRQEVGDLIAFLRAAANPNDGASVLAVLRSPLGGAPDTELAVFAAAGGRLDGADPEAADAKRCPNVRRTLERLADFRRGMVGLPPDAIIRSVIDTTPIALLHASSYEGAQRVANLRKIVAQASDLARRGSSLEETLRFIDREFQGERAEGESPLADETVDAVRILSVHKAKGLEYPVVIVPDVGRLPNRSRSGDAAAAWLRRGSEGYVAVRLGTDVTNLAWAYHVEAGHRHDAAEEKRVFYVACTRARERLILVNSNARRRAAPWRDALAALDYAVDGGFPAAGALAGGSVAHRVLAPSGIAAAPAAASPDPIWSEAALEFERVSRSARATAAPPIEWASGEREERTAADIEAGGEDADGRRGGRLPRDAARLAGTAVHAALERWDFKDAGRLREMARREARWAAEEAAADASDPHDLAAEAGRVAAEIVEALLASSLPGMLSGLDVVGREVPVLYRGDRGVTRLGACDLVYRDADGTIVVADYKTDRVAGNPREAAERYRPQMATYLEAMRRALPDESSRGLRAEILFVRTGTVVPL